MKFYDRKDEIVILEENYSLIERQQMALLRQNIDTHYEQFSGRTLEHYFQQQMMETGRYTDFGKYHLELRGLSMDNM